MEAVAMRTKAGAPITPPLPIVHNMYLTGFRNRLIVLVQWMWAYFTFQRGARLITSPATNASAR
jgi:hypothetical protein